MPAARTWSLDELMNACREYSRTLGRRIFIEWTVIDGANDACDEAAQLAALLAGLDVQVNLIPLNPTAGYDVLRPHRRRFTPFAKRCKPPGFR
ncbi:MAG: hypothetical protein QM775_21260 [Pirellulales bacterium]